MLVSKFLIERLENAGVRHVFGLPGDYVLDFYKELWNSEKIKVVNNTDENHSGFCADAYARINGIGAVVVTYSVGASKVVNAVQCAYAERSPLVIISGAPGMNERNEPFLLHHMVRSFNSQKKMFDEITCASVVLDNAAMAGYEIDRALEALHYYKRPIYIELPRDVAKQIISYDVYKHGTPKSKPTDEENLSEALKDASAWISEAKSPVILAGVEIARYKLGERLVAFAERHNIPVVTTLLSKSVIRENHELFGGIYFGNGSQENVRALVENSDCLLMFGDLLTDMTLCFRPAKFNKRQVISASIESLKIKNHTYTDIQFVDFCKGLFKLDLGKRESVIFEHNLPQMEFDPVANTSITNNRLFAKINSILTKDMVIVSDVGDSLFGAADLITPHQNHFLSPAFYTTMGFAIPGALGVQTANSAIRPIVIVGDGAFQMSCTELSTIAARNLNPIIFVLNNDGFATERIFGDGDFNNLPRWEYHRVVELFGRGKGFVVKTEDELEKAVTESLDLKQLSVINVVLDRKDVSSGLKRMASTLKHK